jgi:hypothetical protein
MARVLGLPIPALATVAAPAAGQALASPTVALFLNSGGDERIAVDPLTGRSRYGTKASTAEDEIWFSSSTASCADPRCFAAAGDVLARFVGSGADHDGNVKSWLDQIRARLVSLFGIPNAEAVLTPSGTEAEFATLSIARALLIRPLTNIVVAPTETGRGVITAAAGRHFLASSSLGGGVPSGAVVEGFDRRPIVTQGIAIRDEAGYPRDPAAIDREAASLVAQALAAGHDVLLHVLDASKTGLSGVTRATARALQRQAGGRLLVVVDACQLRCQPEQLQQDLASGFMVMITGSKFAGGPPFAGALLIPPAMIERLPGKARVPAGLSAYSARFDWPEILRSGFAAELDTPINLGLGLRWEAALAAIEPYFALPEALRMQILTWFAGAVHRRVTARSHLRLISGEPSRAKTIIPIETLGSASTPDGAAELYAALAATDTLANAPAELARACHLGQPVPIGEKAVLRICASMPMVLDIAARIMDGQTIEAAVAPVVNDLDLVFAKWDWLAGA